MVIRRAFLPRRSPGGILVNIASRAGVHGAPGLAAYAATKAGVIALTRSIAAEEQATDLRALVIIPPSIDSDMQHTLLAQDESAFPGVVQSRARRDLGGILSAGDAAHAIINLVLTPTRGGRCSTSPAIARRCADAARYGMIYSWTNGDLFRPPGKRMRSFARPPLGLHRDLMSSVS
jgi:NAD(P)-dependent dehydrogenase (short-subunit alcohol dehydrogenase family)